MFFSEIKIIGVLMSKRSSKIYYRLTSEAIDFYHQNHVGSKNSFVVACGLTAMPVKKALNGERVSNGTATAIRKALQEKGFKGNVFVEVI